ncbi:hypothetical protein KAFR_0B01420 [Kazachstania africana CBS 2517]|uniref:Spindle pole body component SPC42 n=1 Tax=Kazachstania africana (strain ATCC 22294 / BCRC 22015 / CBS 2517 / CECT 1963 / NBRC 1671 / NRRL Y-8276) TaxID=1071382 RepID=H2APZ1_KAZAF|nr:hypothetical protein KAFR_0B01420 [Kazachstania africana CBS 2517]CCF56441.1 hypothetical protein KAFR_0B01420 [Kazachstania africana CBS 2517]
MDISPTPKRYNSRYGLENDRYFKDSNYHFTDPLSKKPYSRYGYKNNLDSIIPPEYKQTSQKMEDLIYQLSHAHATIDAKNVEIDNLKRSISRLESEVDQLKGQLDRTKSSATTLREKLEKYNNLYHKAQDEIKKLQDENYEKELEQNDYIQLNKRRSNHHYTMESPKAEEPLTDNEEIFAQLGHRIHDLVLTSSSSTKPGSQIPSNSSEKTAVDSVTASEYESILRDNAMLKKMEEQVHDFLQLLATKQDNDQRKTSLQRQLAEMKQLLDNGSNINNDTSHSNINAAKIPLVPPTKLDIDSDGQKRFAQRKASIFNTPAKP